MTKTKISYLEHTAKVEIRSPYDHIQKHWMAGNFYETSRNGVLNWVYTFRNKFKGMAAVDVGANIGNHTLFFLKACGMKHVTAIEPGQPQAEHLRKNIQMNRLKKRVAVHEVAAGEKPGFAKFIEPLPENLGMGRIELDESGHTKVRPIGELFPENTALVKIDVEGFEVFALKGMIGAIKEQRPIVIIETTDHYSTIADMLGRCGYNPVHHWIDGNPKPTKFNHGSTYIFLPE